MKPLLSLLLLLVAFRADAATHALYGRVVDRNGEPVARVNVAVTPGNVEIITDETGRFRIDYLRDEKGERIRLARRTSYAFTFFKVGYHEARTNVEYKRGEVELATVTLKEDTLELSASTDNLDPAATTARDAASGGSYEGE